MPEFPTILAECLHDPSEIAALLSRAPELNSYQLGDLDPFFWPHTTWWRLPGRDELALLYTGVSVPTLLLFVDGDLAPGQALLAGVADRLPPRLYAHLSPGLADALQRTHHHTKPSRHLKMALRNTAKLAGVDTSGVEPLEADDLGALSALYARAYPDNWFDPRMLETGQYVGVRQGGDIICVAGIHVFAPRQGAAALGNITTDPVYRGQGLATRTVAALCRQLLEHVQHITLNVSASNGTAIHCYKRLGFETVAEYDELMLTWNGQG
jgi:ribosomal protein S18 acetylase RimI-like enzyme